MHNNLYCVQVEEKYKDLLKIRIENIGDYINVLDSTYLLYTNKTAKEIYENLSIDNKFNAFIIKCELSDYYGFLNKKVWEWLYEKKL